MATGRDKYIAMISHRGEQRMTSAPTNWKACAIRSSDLREKYGVVRWFALQGKFAWCRLMFVREIADK